MSLYLIIQIVLGFIPNESSSFTWPIPTYPSHDDSKKGVTSFSVIGRIDFQRLAILGQRISLRGSDDDISSEYNLSTSRDLEAVEQRLKEVDARKIKILREIADAEEAEINERQRLENLKALKVAKKYDYITDNDENFKDIVNSNLRNKHDLPLTGILSGLLAAAVGTRSFLLTTNEKREQHQNMILNCTITEQCNDEIYAKSFENDLEENEKKFVTTSLVPAFRANSVFCGDNLSSTQYFQTTSDEEEFVMRNQDGETMNSSNVDYEVMSIDQPKKYILKEHQQSSESKEFMGRKSEEIQGLLPNELRDKGNQSALLLNHRMEQEKDILPNDATYSELDKLDSNQSEAIHDLTHDDSPSPDFAITDPILTETEDSGKSGKIIDCEEFGVRSYSQVMCLKNNADGDIGIQSMKNITSLNQMGTNQSVKCESNNFETKSETSESENISTHEVPCRSTNSGIARDSKNSGQYSDRPTLSSSPLFAQKELLDAVTKLRIEANDRSNTLFPRKATPSVVRKTPVLQSVGVSDKNQSLILKGDYTVESEFGDGLVAFTKVFCEFNDLLQISLKHEKNKKESNDIVSLKSNSERTSSNAALQRSLAKSGMQY